MLVSHRVSTLSSQSERVLYQTCFQNWCDTSKIMDGGYIKQNQKSNSVSVPLMFVSSYLYSVLRYTEDVDVVFTKNNSPLLTSIMNQNALWQLKSPQTKTRQIKDASWQNGSREKVGRKNGEVGFLFECLFCGRMPAEVF